MSMYTCLIIYQDMIYNYGMYVHVCLFIILGYIIMLLLMAMLLLFLDFIMIYNCASVSCFSCPGCCFETKEVTNIVYMYNYDQNFLLLLICVMLPFTIISLIIFILLNKTKRIFKREMNKF